MATKNSPIIPLDDKENLNVCDCEFTPYADSEEESWHFLRRCRNCGNTWYSLHCPHDNHQVSCGKCSQMPKPIVETD